MDLGWVTIPTEEFERLMTRNVTLTAYEQGDPLHRAIARFMGFLDNKKSYTPEEKQALRELRDELQDFLDERA